MPRYALLVEYDGAGFVGWQRQETGLSVQQALEEAAAPLAPLDPVVAVAAGRTDAGVHAEAQVVHLDLAREIDPRRLREALNFHLGTLRVAVLAAARAPEGFHARFSAIGRAYRYDILDRRARPALLAGRVWHVKRRLDEAAMQAAAALLVGRHDFSSFRAASCQAASAVKTLDRLDIVREGDLVRIGAEARSFLHHQVRNIAGTLKLVGEGRWTPADVAAALAARDRSAAGPTAPAEGLTLTAVRYPVDPFAA
ncbi:tRNA pseudouridine(38-40) synthase TruA [Elioraea sp. Yellowstone]|jgi:tRNA pseudouridine38-40 synthase|uniref:tRNA pseudouridine(38-40) synthase TruA n=1 Tax=Elioraea sp. Yellowstone TaxID=2592070 RepID=UPI001150217D|nr:tRNA pseudouridine(38-40) synthase TruA [Elioraea sp. Yellowstone]TQF80111.1 tRNA pseudouridine(38-40) synthase TruA [Elioraea sp. Yellowstone]